MHRWKVLQGRLQAQAAPQASRKEGGAIVIDIFRLTCKLYDARVAAIRKQTGHRVLTPIAQREWCNADRIARDAAQREQAQTLINREYAQRLMLGAAIDTSYAPLLAPQQSHAEAVHDGLQDVRA